MGASSGVSEPAVWVLRLKHADGLVGSSNGVTSEGGIGWGVGINCRGLLEATTLLRRRIWGVDGLSFLGGMWCCLNASAAACVLFL